MSHGTAALKFAHDMKDDVIAGEGLFCTLRKANCWAGSVRLKPLVNA